LPNGASELEFGRPPDPAFRVRLGIPDDDFVFLTVGSPISMKGHKAVAEAFAKVILNGRSATLILNGNWPEPPTLGRAWRLMQRMAFILRSSIQGASGGRLGGIEDADQMHSGALASAKRKDDRRLDQGGAGATWKTGGVQQSAPKANTKRSADISRGNCLPCKVAKPGGFGVFSEPDQQLGLVHASLHFAPAFIFRRRTTRRSSAECHNQKNC
jgi:hypothetical protein